MALSNILREPRREITESVTGIITLSVVLGADYSFGSWVSNSSRYADGSTSISVPEGMIMGLFLALAAALFLFVTHEFGEFVCNKLQTAGVHLRPRQRNHGRDGCPGE